MKTWQRASLFLGTGCWLGYLTLLAPLVAYAVIRYSALYSADSLMTQPELSEQYKTFVGLSGLGLAISLGVVSAAFGIWRTSLLQGLLVLALGVVTTVAALSVVPLVRFPEDQYPPAALWVMTGSLPLALTFVIATTAGCLLTRGRSLQLQTSS